MFDELFTQAISDKIDDKLSAFEVNLDDYDMDDKVKSVIKNLQFEITAY